MNLSKQQLRIEEDNVELCSSVKKKKHTKKNNNKKHLNFGVNE